MADSTSSEAFKQARNAFNNVHNLSFFEPNTKSL